MARRGRIAGKHTYVSCYSCPRSEIFEDSNGGRAARCDINGRSVRIVRGMSYPSWCELYGVNHKRGA